MSKPVRLIATVLIMCALGGGTQAATVDRVLNVQGMLYTSAGLPASGTFPMVLELYVSETATAPIWDQSLSGVVVDEGGFDVQLGPIPEGLVEDNPGLWLGTVVDGEELPRQPLRAVAYALLAGSAQTAGDLLCSACVGSDDVDFPWAAANEKGGAATDVDCDHCIDTSELEAGSVATGHLQVGAVTSGNVDFNYADSLEKGGAAKDVACSGCVTGGEIEPGVELSGDVTVTGGLQACKSNGSGCAVKVSESGLYDHNNGWLSVQVPDGVRIRDTADGAYRPMVFGGGTSYGDVAVEGGSLHVSGRVGVGTASPQAMVDVVSSDGASPPVVRLAAGGSALGSRIDLLASGVGARFESTLTGGPRVRLGTVTSTALELLTGDATRLVIDGAGRVGLGTLTPSARLTIDTGDTSTEPLRIDAPVQGGGNVSLLADWEWVGLVTLTSTAGELADVQVRVVLDTATLIAAGKMKADGADIRFTDDDAATLLPFWVESGLNTSATVIWVRVPSLPASGTKKLFLFYGNPAATSLSHAKSTFLRVIDEGEPLVAGWSFDEGAGGTVKDGSGNGHDGTLLPTPSWVDGKHGKALLLDANDGVEVANTGGAFDLVNAFTIAAWVRPDVPGTDSRSDPIVWKLATTGGNLDNFLLSWTAGSRYQVGIERASDDADLSVVSKPHTQGVWTHVVGVYTGSELRVYVDGALEGTLITGAAVPYTGSAPLRIGNLLHSDHGEKGVFDGVIDEVQILDAALTDAEIADLATGRAYSTPAYPGAILLRRPVASEPSFTIGAGTTPQLPPAEKTTVLTVQAGTGNVGVGTANPDRRLDVQGETRLSGDVDLALHELKSFRVHNAAAPPVACSAGATGVMYFDTTDKALRVCDGTDYKTVGEQPPPPLQITPSSSFSQQLLTASSGTPLWTDRTYSFTSAPSGVLPGTYIRGPMSTGPLPCGNTPGANQEGGAVFSVNAPVRVTVACAHHCGPGEGNVPLGSGWTSVTGSHYSITDHGGAPLHFYTKEYSTAPSGNIQVCCKGCWASGVFVEAL